VSERVTFDFGFSSDWMKKWRDFFLSQSCSVVSANPITFQVNTVLCTEIGLIPVRGTCALIFCYFLKELATFCSYSNELKTFGTRIQKFGK